jgi:hypothetical protein
VRRADGATFSWRENDEIVIGFKYVGVARRSDRHQIKSFMTALMRACRETTMRRLQPTRVTLTHRREQDCSEFNAFMGCVAEFGAECDELALPAAVKELPLVGADPYLNELLTAYCER